MTAHNGSDRRSRRVSFADDLQTVHLYEKDSTSPGDGISTADSLYQLEREVEAFNAGHEEGTGSGYLSMETDADTENIKVYEDEFVEHTGPLPRKPLLASLADEDAENDTMALNGAERLHSEYQVVPESPLSPAFAPDPRGDGADPPGKHDDDDSWQPGEELTMEWPDTDAAAQAQRLQNQVLPQLPPGMELSDATGSFTIRTMDPFGQGDTSPLHAFAGDERVAAAPGTRALEDQPPGAGAQPACALGSDDEDKLLDDDDEGDPPNILLGWGPPRGGQPAFSPLSPDEALANNNTTALLTEDDDDSRYGGAYDTVSMSMSSPRMLAETPRRPRTSFATPVPYAITPDSFAPQEFSAPVDAGHSAPESCPDVLPGGGGVHTPLTLTPAAARQRPVTPPGASPLTRTPPRAASTHGMQLRNSTPRPRSPLPSPQSTAARRHRRGGSDPRQSTPQPGARPQGHDWADRDTGNSLPVAASPKCRRSPRLTGSQPEPELPFLSIPSRADNAATAAAPLEPTAGPSTNLLKDLDSGTLQGLVPDAETLATNRCDPPQAPPGDVVALTVNTFHAGFTENLLAEDTVPKHAALLASLDDAAAADCWLLGPPAASTHAAPPPQIDPAAAAFVSRPQLPRTPPSGDPDGDEGKRAPEGAADVRALEHGDVPERVAVERGRRGGALRERAVQPEALQTPPSEASRERERQKSGTPTRSPSVLKRKRSRASLSSPAKKRPFTLQNRTASFFRSPPPTTGTPLITIVEDEPDTASPLERRDFYAAGVSLAWSPSGAAPSGQEQPRLADGSAATAAATPMDLDDDAVPDGFGGGSKLARTPPGQQRDFSLAQAAYEAAATPHSQSGAFGVRHQLLQGGLAPDAATPATARSPLSNVSVQDFLRALGLQDELDCAAVPRDTLKLDNVPVQGQLRSLKDVLSWNASGTVAAAVLAQRHQQLGEKCDDLARAVHALECDLGQNNPLIFHMHKSASPNEQARLRKDVAHAIEAAVLQAERAVLEFGIETETRLCDALTERTAWLTQAGAQANAQQVEVAQMSSQAHQLLAACDEEFARLKVQEQQVAAATAECGERADRARGVNARIDQARASATLLQTSLNEQRRKTTATRAAIAEAQAAVAARQARLRELESSQRDSAHSRAAQHVLAAEAAARARCELLQASLPFQLRAVRDAAAADLPGEARYLELEWTLPAGIIATARVRQQTPPHLQQQQPHTPGVEAVTVRYVLPRDGADADGSLLRAAGSTALSHRCVFLARSLGMTQLPDGGAALAADCHGGVERLGGAMKAVAAYAAALEGMLADFADLKLRVPMVTTRSIAADGLLRFSVVCLRTWTKVVIEAAVSRDEATSQPRMSCASCKVTSVHAPSVSEEQCRAAVAATAAGVQCVSACAATIRRLLLSSAAADAPESEDASLAAAVQRLGSAVQEAFDSVHHSSQMAPRQPQQQPTSLHAASSPNPIRPPLGEAQTQATPPHAHASPARLHCVQPIAARGHDAGASAVDPSERPPDQATGQGGELSRAVARPREESVEGTPPAAAVGGADDSNAAGSGAGDGETAHGALLTGPFPEGAMEVTAALASAQPAPPGALPAQPTGPDALTPPATSHVGLPVHKRWHENPLFSKH